MLGGARVPPLPDVADPVTHLLGLQQASFREDDVIVAAYPESGADCLLGLIPWLLRPSLSNGDQGGDHISHQQARCRAKPLELMTPEELETMTSPRIFLTHLYMAHLPPDAIHKNVKIIHVVRNPKDVTASLYHRLNRDSVCSFQQFLDIYLTNQIGIGHQFDFLKQMTQFQQAHKDHPVLEIHFEDIVKRPVDTLGLLGQFLQVAVSGSLTDHILSSSSLLPSLGTDDQNLLGRQELVGGWKFLFTMTTNEAFDFFIFQSLGTNPIKFRYN